PVKTTGGPTVPTTRPLARRTAAAPGSPTPLHVPARPPSNLTSAPATAMQTGTLCAIANNLPTLTAAASSSAAARSVAARQEATSEGAETHALCPEEERVAQHDGDEHSATEERADHGLEPRHGARAQVGEHPCHDSGQRDRVRNDLELEVDGGDRNERCQEGRRHDEARRRAEH